MPRPSLAIVPPRVLLPGLAAAAMAGLLVLAAAAAGAALGALSTAGPRWTGWIGSSAAPWIVAAWVLARTADGPASAVGTVGAGVAAMMLTYEGAQALLDPGASFGYTAPWIVVTVGLALAAGIWRRWSTAHPGTARAAGAGAVALPTVVLAGVQVVHRAPPGMAVGVVVALTCAAAVIAADRAAVRRRPRAAWAGALAGTALFTLGGLLVVVP
ncbi:hypothetical protein [Patulibacter minatonensis]|uniref:hypothetical protein n=1 Tax=Patulibacter minatonensis TaxID=298163 RepID=UPI00047CBCB5|nr:hypothetical protein [Patulibacter minatonensis]